MNRLATGLMDAAWKIAMLGLLAVGVQTVGNTQPLARPVPRSDQPPTAETARLAEGSGRLVDTAVQPREANSPVEEDTAHEPEPQTADARVKAGPTAMTYGPNGTFITLAEYHRSHPDARYQSGKPRPRWTYRPPTPRITPAQIAWARMLPNYDGLRMRGLTDEQVVACLAPSEVKALEGDTVPEHLRPDLAPQVVSINQRCADGTCETGYCPASRDRMGCKNGVCPVPRR